MEITSASPSKPKTSVESEGKFCEVDESCETDGQPICLSTKKVSYMDNSIDLENLSPGDAFKDNGHTRIHEHASTPSRKRLVCMHSSIPLLTCTSICLLWQRYFLN
jgi:hypothetical protein